MIKLKSLIMIKLFYDFSLSTPLVNIIVPLQKIEKAYAIDNEDCDDAVRRCQFLTLVDTYSGGQDSEMLSVAAMQVIIPFNYGKNEAHF